jgi:hypothetical protein
MGVVSSNNNGSSNLNIKPSAVDSNSDVVKAMMPVYYTEEELAGDEAGRAVAAWNSVVDDSAPEFNRLKETRADFSHPSALTYFYDTFYHRFFDIHPVR